MRTKLLSIHRVPYLRSQTDEQLKKESAIVDLLNQVEKENAARDRERQTPSEPQVVGHSHAFVT